MAEYCVVFVDSDGWSFRWMEPVWEDLEYAKEQARERKAQTGLPVLGVADRNSRTLVFRTDGQSLDLPLKFQVEATD